MKVNVNIAIDEQGFLIVKCKNCGENFKVHLSDIDDDGVLFIYCPTCGLHMTTFITDEVLELGKVKLQNKLTEFIYNQNKLFERRFKNSSLSFKIGKKPKAIYERVLSSGIDILEKTKFPCCQKECKIKPLLKFTGCYCPFCGVKCDEIK